ncbi:MAG: class I SAM-dependent methyltransferase [Verrucomicrobiota bacterium]
MNQLADIIRQEVGQGGPLSFRRYMELVLYHPALGYYEKPVPDQTGRQGDFYTSVSVGAVFGELLAHFILAQTRELSRPMHIVEAGAHTGHLARDILQTLQTIAPELLAQTQYRILDPSAHRRAAQAETLKAFPNQVIWLNAIADLPDNSLHGVILSNELLDAFPVHRLGWSAADQAWFEWLVDWEDTLPTWYRTETTALPAELKPHLPAPSPELARLLPDGFTTEICPAAPAWWSQAARKLNAGCLLTFDYGLEALDFLSPERAQGTLRAYRNHRLVDNPLANPGEQDLTAHINFTALRETGEQAGLATIHDEAQARFLTRILAQASAGKGNHALGWSPAQIRQFQTLTHPDHLGRSFRVLAQQR